MTSAQSATHGDPPLRVALIGIGRVARQRLVPAINRIEGLRLGRVYDEDPNLAQLFAQDQDQNQELQAPQAVALQLDELLEDPDIDALIVASADRKRSPIARDGLAAGKACWLEMPFCDSPETLDSILSAAQSQELQLGIGHPLRWSRPHQLIAKEIQEQQLGEIHRISIHWGQTPGPDRRLWTQDAKLAAWGVGAALGTHVIDLLQFLIPFSPQDILERQVLLTRAPAPPHFDQELTASFRLQSGTIVDLRLSQRYNCDSRLEIFGSKSNILAENTLSMDGRGEVVDSQRAWLSYNRIDPYEAALRHWIDGLRGIKVKPSPSAEELALQRRYHLLLLRELAAPVEKPVVEEAAIGINTNVDLRS